MKQFDIKNIEEEWLPLVKEFPEIFLEPSPEVESWHNQYAGNGIPEKKEDLCNLRFSFECGIGWIEVIRKLCQDITEFINNERANGYEAWAKSCIIKEKFGELAWQGDQRFGREGAWKEFYDLIHAAEKKSVETCELTGEPGNLCCKKQGRWYKTLSPEKAEELGYEKV